MFIEKSRIHVNKENYTLRYYLKHIMYEPGTQNNIAFSRLPVD